MEFNNLNYFRTVAKYGNLSRAAKELYISQPGLSRYISRLEDEVGVPLFDRRRGKIELNTYGKIFLTNVNLAFDQLENGVESIQQLYYRDQNILSVACSIEDFLIDRLQNFSPTHPEIGIRQFSYSIPEIENQILKQNLDFAVCAHPPQSEHIRYEKISSCPYMLVCHEDNPLASRESIYLIEAKKQHFICENSRLTKKELERICRDVGFVPRVSHEIENGYILVNLLEANAGVALVPLAFSVKIESHYPNHHLRSIPLKDEKIPYSEIGIAYLAEKKLTTSALCFMDYLRGWSSLELESLEEIRGAMEICAADVEPEDRTDVQTENDMD